MDKLLKWQIGGMIFLLLFGSLWHFMFELTGRNLIGAAFFPVNESVWEHMKLFFYPFLIFSVIEWFFIGKDFSGFFVAKSWTCFFMIIMILGLFYLLEIFFPGNFVKDIVITVIVIIVALFVDYKIMKEVNSNGFVNFSSVVAIVMIGILMAFFTFFPPHNTIFQDHPSGGYGIISETDHEH